MDPVQDELERMQQAATAPAIARVLELLAAGAVGVPVTRTLAAAVLLRSDDPVVVQTAHDLLVAAMAGHRPARRLAATAFDRLRVLAGRPQKFGTQRRADGGLFAVDPTTTDSERAKWDLPPRRELEAAAAPERDRPGGGS